MCGVPVPFIHYARKSRLSTPGLVGNTGLAIWQQMLKPIFVLRSCSATELIKYIFIYIGLYKLVLDFNQSR